MGSGQEIALWVAGGGVAFMVPLLATSRMVRTLRRMRRARISSALGAQHGGPARARGPELRPFAGRVFVIDGDTIVVKRARVRLFGMDAPELTQRGGERAKAYLIGMAGGKEVRVEPREVDCYGRLVARVWCDDTDLSEAMVRGGFAVAASRWHNDYDSAELDARRARRGLWSEDAFDGITDPAAHRRQRAVSDPGCGPKPGAPRAAGRPGEVVRFPRERQTR